MKKMILAAIAAVAACAVCCIPLLIPAAAGLTIFGFQLFRTPVSLEAILCAVAPALLAAVAVFVILKMMRRPVKPKCAGTSCSRSGDCGCK